MNKKILITGGLGFLGSYAIERFTKEGWDIHVIDNLSTNAIDQHDKLLSHATFQNVDVLDYSWESNDTCFDLILHLASPVGPAGVLKHSGKMGRQIIDDVYWAIDGAVQMECPLVFISTSEIYGYRAEAEALKEDDYKLLIGDFKVRNEYSMAKLLAEIILSNTAKVESRLNYHAIRPFNISGARQQPDGGFVLPRFVKQALSNETITVFGSGQQVRAFTHAEDIIDGIFKIANATDFYKNEIWNIGNPQNKCTINYMAEKVRDSLDTLSHICLVNPKDIYGPLYEEAWDKIPNSNKIKSLLGWEPKHDIDSIINDVITYWQRKV